MILNKEKGIGGQEIRLSESPNFTILLFALNIRLVNKIFENIILWMLWKTFNKTITLIC